MSLRELFSALLTTLAAFTWANALLVLAGAALALAGARWKRAAPLLPLGVGCLLSNLSPAFVGRTLFDVFGQDTLLRTLPVLALVGAGFSLDLPALLRRPRSILFAAVAQAGVLLALLLAGYWKFSLPGAAVTAVSATLLGPAALLAAGLLRPELAPAVAVAAWLGGTLLPLLRNSLLHWLAPAALWSGDVQPGEPLVSRRGTFILPVLVLVACGLLAPATLLFVGPFLLGGLVRAAYASRLKSGLQLASALATGLLALGLGLGLTPATLLIPETGRILVLTAVAMAVNGLIWALSIRYVPGASTFSADEDPAGALTGLLAAGVIVTLATFAG